MTKNFLITGVSRGLGREIALKLLSECDCRVLGVGRSGASSVADIAEKFGGRFAYLPFDISRTDEIAEEVFGKFVGLKTPLDGLVNNAAIAYADLATNLKAAPLREMFDVNVFAAMFFTKCALRNMILHGRRGSVVHISSVCAAKGFKGLAMYAATKGALEAFSKGIAREWGARGIRSNCVAAGFMQTDMSAGLSEEALAKIFARTALKSPVQTASVAGTVKFLLSDESASITGQTLAVDAGA